MQGLVLDAGPISFSWAGGPKRPGFGRFGRIARGLVAARFAIPVDRHHPKSSLILLRDVGEK